MNNESDNIGLKITAQVIASIKPMIRPGYEVSLMITDPKDPGNTFLISSGVSTNKQEAERLIKCLECIAKSDVPTETLHFKPPVNPSKN